MNQSLEKKKAYDKAYRIDNREEILAYDKAYRATHREKYRAHYSTHQNREQRRAHYIAHREKYRAYSKAYYAAHKTEKHLKEQNVKSWLRKRVRLDEYKASCGCCICAENIPAALDLHHVGKKNFQLAERRRHSAELIAAELKNCMVICSNCHRKFHAGLLSPDEIPEELVNDTQ